MTIMSKGEISMKTFVQNLANLIKVKTLVTLVVIAVFTVLALKGAINSDSVMYIVTTVVAFYFGTQQEKKANQTKDGE